MLRRIAAFSMIMVLVMSLVGYYPVLMLAKKQFRREFREKINAGFNPADLLVIELPKADQELLKWEEEGEEFSFKGKLYDVVRCDSSGQSYKYFCFEDNKEHDLVSNFTRLIAQDHNGDDGLLRSKTFQWLKILFNIVYIGDDFFQFSAESLIASIFTKTASALSPGYLRATLQPPAY